MGTACLRPLPDRGPPELCAAYSRIVPSGVAPALPGLKIHGGAPCGGYRRDWVRQSYCAALTVSYTLYDTQYTLSSSFLKNFTSVQKVWNVTRREMSDVLLLGRQANTCDDLFQLSQNFSCVCRLHRTVRIGALIQHQNRKEFVALPA